MVFSHISNSKFLPNGAGVLVVCITNSRHVEIAIKMIDARQACFVESIPTIHVLIWVDSFSNEQFSFMAVIVFKPKELVANLS